MSIVTAAAAPARDTRAAIAAPVHGFVACETLRSDDGKLRVRAEQPIKRTDPHLAAHFPGFTVYPGVFLLESVAQAARVAIGDEGFEAHVSGVESMRFLAPLLEGHTLELEATIEPLMEDRGHRIGAVCRRGDGVEAARITLTLGPGAAGSEPGGGALAPPAIRSLLPHGQPMLLVDRVVQLDPGRSIVALKAITLTDPCYGRLERAVAPRAYAYPTSMLLESFGQTAALLWLAGRESLRGDSVLMLATARDARIEGQAIPGDVVRHVARLEHVVGEHLFVSGESFVGERRIARIGSMMAAVRPRSALDCAAHGSPADGKRNASQEKRHE